MSFDTPAENKAFKDKFEFPFPLLSDTTRQMAIAYGAAKGAGDATPQRAACVITADGTVHRWWAQVDPKTFPESVLQELP